MSTPVSANNSLGKYSPLFVQFSLWHARGGIRRSDKRAPVNGEFSPFFKRGVITVWPRRAIVTSITSNVENSARVNLRRRQGSTTTTRPKHDEVVWVYASSRRSLRGWGGGITQILIARCWGCCRLRAIDSQNPWCLVITFLCAKGPRLLSSRVFLAP